jgi:hypothetical protein
MPYTRRRYRDTTVAACNAPGGEISMRVRNITTCALGLAAALTLVSDLAAQQDTTRLRTTSQTRISVSKGAVEMPPRVDTVFVTRYDTIRVSNTIVRVDTVTVTPPPPVIVPTIKGPFYWAVFGGTTWPWGNVDRLYTNGFHAGGAIGIESQNSPIGFRLDGGMSQIGREQGRPASLVGTGTPLMLHVAADLKAKALMFRGWSFYGIGGVNYNRYKRIALVADNGTAGCVPGGRNDCYEPADDANWSDKFGFNFGLGTDFHIGSQDMFIEARYVAIMANSARTWFLPVSLGVRYF